MVAEITESPSYIKHNSPILLICFTMGPHQRASFLKVKIKTRVLWQDFTDSERINHDKRLYDSMTEYKAKQVN